MPNYLFLSDSKFVISKLVEFLPNHYQDYGNLIRYEYNGNYIHINKFIDNRIRMRRLLLNIADLEFTFDKIFVLVGNITNHFKSYINGLSKNLVKSESDVIVFKLKSIKSDFNFISNDDCCCCNLCVICFGFRRHYYQSSDAIFVNINSTCNLDYNPDYFINYLKDNTNLNKTTIISEKIIRDVNISNETIPIVVAELVTTNTKSKYDNINYFNINLEPSAPLAD